MEQLNKVDAKFQCKVHELRNDKDWVNFKRSVVRAPQIVKQAINAGSQMEKDQIFDAFWGKFVTTYNEFEDLQTHIIEYNNHTRNYLLHMKKIGEAFKKVFVPNLSTKETYTCDSRRIPTFGVFTKSTVKGNIGITVDGSEASEGYLEDDGNDQQFSLATKFANKVEEIIEKITPNLDCVMENVKEPLKNMTLIFDRIKQSETERAYAILDVNKYQDGLSSLQKRQRETTLTLKQEQNLVKYEKDLELAQFKFDKINDQFKRELPHVFEHTQSFIHPISKVFYFLQLTINFHLLSLNEIQDSFFKLSSKSTNLPTRQFFTQVTENYHKKHNAILEDILKLSITKSQDEVRMLRYKLDSSRMKDKQGSKTGYQEEISEAGSIRSLIKTCIAEYDYTAQQDGDLSFKKGDRIRIIDEKFNENWWKGELNGLIGIFPRNYVIVE
ncbi:hypothetical protein WICPIJ_000911 [Wickerhamomyces pijperi]|uniref:SH3 domain-containing protein n=1 Tax=Wickerhamomyces pijperi TaxID=599730 RepID=A0A9P8QES9_WICPI|nr:hypothetical protein WICPIJ_000911 [Wickerhamomyces pijperi]